MCAGKRKSNSLFIASSCFVLQTSSRHPVKLPLFLSPRCARPPPPPPPPPPRLAFLAAASCMGAFLEQKQICLVPRHFLSPDPCLFYHVWKQEQRGYSGEKNVLTPLPHVLLHSALHRPSLFSTRWQTLNVIVTRDIFSLVQLLKDFLACFWGSSQRVNCICSGLEPRNTHSWAQGLENCPRWTDRRKWPDNHWGSCCRCSRNMTCLYLVLHSQSPLMCVKA